MNFRNTVLWDHALTVSKIIVLRATFGSRMEEVTGFGRKFYDIELLVINVNFLLFSGISRHVIE
jgi:hypothetical protein